MGSVGSLQSDAVVRTLTIVEGNEAVNLLQCFLKRIKTSFLTVYALTLDDAVHALCKGIVGGFVVLRHRDLYAILLQFLHIEVAAVLDTAVRVVDVSPERSPPPACSMAMRRALSVKTAARDSARHQPTIFFE